MRAHNVKVGDVICLNSYPFKPMEVIGKSSGRIGLAPYPDKKSIRWFHLESFEELEYVPYESFNLW